MLAAILIPKLQHRFADHGLRVGDSPCAVFPAVHADVGDIHIYDDGDELTVVVGNFTHGHFADYDEHASPELKAERIVEDVANFLEELFADRIVLWGSHQFGGGWCARDRQHPSGLKTDGKKYVWSGPLS